MSTFWTQMLLRLPRDSAETLQRPQKTLERFSRDSPATPQRPSRDSKRLPRDSLYQGLSRDSLESLLKVIEAPWTLGSQETP